MFEATLRAASLLKKHKSILLGTAICMMCMMIYYQWDVIWASANHWHLYLVGAYPRVVIFFELIIVGFTIVTFLAQWLTWLYASKTGDFRPFGVACVIAFFYPQFVGVAISFLIIKIRLVQWGIV